MLKNHRETGAAALEHVILLSCLLLVVAAGLGSNLATEVYYENNRAGQLMKITKVYETRDTLSTRIRYKLASAAAGLGATFTGGGSETSEDVGNIPDE